MPIADHVPRTAEAHAPWRGRLGHVQMIAITGLSTMDGRRYTTLQPDEARRLAAELLVAAEECETAREIQHG